MKKGLIICLLVISSLGVGVLGTNIYYNNLPKTQVEQQTADKEIEKEKELSKFKQFYQVLTRWMLNADSTVFYNILKDKYSVSRCIIYGYAELGQILEKELLKSSIQIDGIIDKKRSGLSNSGIVINRPEDFKEYGVPVIVTATYYYEDIKKELQGLGHKYIYSLFEIVSNL